MRLLRILLALLFGFLALNAWAQVILVFTGSSEEPWLLPAWQVLVGATGAAAAWGSWKATRWAPLAAAAYGVVTGSMIVALGPMLDLDAAARGGLWTGGAVVLGFGLVSALFLRKAGNAPTMKPHTQPTFAEWVAMSDDERRRVIDRWNPYGGEGLELLNQITEDFRAKYGHLRGIDITGPAVYHGGQWVIAVNTPFVFDRRTLPNVHLGIMMHYSYPAVLPPEFSDGTRTNEYVWAPEHYEQFVDRAADDIRRELGDPGMSREDMLAALVGMPFGKFVQLTKR